MLARQPPDDNLKEYLSDQDRRSMDYIIGQNKTVPTAPQRSPARAGQAPQGLAPQAPAPQGPAASGALIVDGDQRTFMAEVIEASKTIPVLVDFWATWCGPCVAGLPHMQGVYKQYHDKGLEVVGVSNDFQPDALVKFTAQKQMPWVELIDKDAAAKHQWNPTTLGYGINGIPTLFLIDKKGVCRSVTARNELETLVPKLLAE